ncbi:fibrillin-1-like [Ruditapes philippinarum]|uniref:fibrillin-1-like n=1 Tax=Ruditapes philippinarum TaxID=129788 RepID=UPI00295A6508|nr:fibrillin-1-like [Ruditapes philippinarum]
MFIHCFIDIDECSVDYSEADKCEQNCTNTDGSFKCSCFNGYDLNSDRRSCDDIDECNKGLTLCHGKNEACVNTPGNYSCICVAGYDRSGGVCEKLNGPQFVGNIVFVIDKEPSAGDNKTIDSPKNRLEMQTKLKEMFKLYKNVESVEVFRLLYIEKRRTKRQDSQKQYLLQVNYIVHCKNKTDYTSMSERLKGSVEKYKANISNDKPVVLGEVTININSAEAKVNNSTEGGRCTVPGKTDCAKDSTNCNDYDDGTFNCTCKIGYKPSFANVEYKYCNDIDECKEFTANNTIKKRCIYGVCRNSIGSWNCTCNPDRLWKNIGNDSYPVYRCQGNYSYIGNISVADHDPSKKTNIVEFIQNQLKTFYEDPKNDNDSYTVPMSSLFVNARVLGLFKNISHSSFRQYNATFLLRIGETVESGRLFNVLKKVLSQGDYRTNTSSLVFENNSYVIFNDSDNKLCAFGSNGNCDKVTTTCRQKDGSTLCDCKEGFNKTSVSMKYCTDINECEIEGKCNNEKCVNSIGNWSCKCNNSYSIPVSTDKDNFSCKDVSICEYKNNDFQCINGNKTCRIDTKWECTCKKGFSPVYKNINTIECEGMLS